MERLIQRAEVLPQVIVRFVLMALCLSSCGAAAQLMVDGKPFRGKIVYQGTYSANVEIPTPPNQRNTVRFGGVQIPMGPSGRIENFKGALTLEAEYDGPAVTLSWKATGVLDPAKMSGVVTNGQCELTDNDKGSTSRMLAQCDTSVFSGKSTNLEGSRQKIDVTYQANVIQVVDYTERDRKQAESTAASRVQSAKAAAKAKQDREADAAMNEQLLRSLPPVGRSQK
jgi:hypothetical protein